MGVAQDAADEPEHWPQLHHQLQHQVGQQQASWEHAGPLRHDQVPEEPVRVRVHVAGEELPEDVHHGHVGPPVVRHDTVVPRPKAARRHHQTKNASPTPGRASAFKV